MGVCEKSERIEKQTEVSLKELSSLVCRRDVVHYDKNILE